MSRTVLQTLEGRPFLKCVNVLPWFGVQLLASLLGRREPGPCQLATGGTLPRGTCNAYARVVRRADRSLYDFACGTWHWQLLVVCAAVDRGAACVSYM